MVSTNEEITDEGWIQQFDDFLKKHGSRGYCVSFQKNRHGNTKKKCNCLWKLGRDEYPGY